ncbi:MAG: T9SS type A sorting domain-containing protein, partial [Candidatus Marinimicrobia bacterium]|nr:T9SS type A sorting domain-containing protein [Candidatus Neomarinimicrobiota bacterium]
GGVMIWALGQDVIGDDQPLAETVGRSMNLVSGIYSSQQGIPESFLLLKNYPNPFNASTVIPFYLAKEEEIHLEVFDILGRQITTLVNEKKTKGWHKVYFSSAGIPSGLYFYKIQSSSFSKIYKMAILK